MLADRVTWRGQGCAWSLAGCLHGLFSVVMKAIEPLPRYNVAALSPLRILTLGITA